MAIDYDMDFHNRESVAWLEKGVGSLRVDSMDEGIESTRDEEFLFIVINSDNINYLSKLNLLRSISKSCILVMASNFTGKEHADALNNGADAFGVIDIDPKVNFNSINAVIKKASMKANLRENSTMLVSHNNIFILPKTGRTFIGDLEVSLSKSEISVLCLLINENGNALSCGEIFDSVFGESDGVDPENIIKSVIKRIRRKAGDISIIENVWGRGYRIGTCK